MRLGKYPILAALLVSGAAYYFTSVFTWENPLPEVAHASPRKEKLSGALFAPSSFSAPIVTAKAPPVASSPSLLALLPGVTEHPADWRQFQPDTLTVEPLPGHPVTFTRTQTKTEGKYTTWIGHNDQIPGASLVGVSTAKRYDAVMVLPGLSQFSVHVDPDGHAFVQEADPGAEGCGVEAAQPNRTPTMTTPAALYQVVPPAAAAAAAGAAPSSSAAPFVAAAITAPNQVDVLFIYDANTLTAAKGVSSDPTGYIDGYSKGLIESGNIALAQSQVTSFQWRYLGSEAAPAFTQTNQLSDDLDAMTFTFDANGNMTDVGAISQWLLSERYDRGADQVMLWHGGSSDYGGEAYSVPQQPIFPLYAVGVAEWGSSYKTVVHELAHNFGCEHDRANANNGDGSATTPAADNNGLYCYGQLWTNPAPIPNFPYPNTASTIMGYGSAIIPYYSNPNITLQITSALAGWPANVSSWGTQALGVAVGQPRAAYNAKVLQDNGPEVAQNFDEILPPKIITQPIGLNVTPGQSFTLSVIASGGGLQDTWYKDGQRLMPTTVTATQANNLGLDLTNSLSGTTLAPGTDRLAIGFSNATSSMSGNYYVVVSNRLGSVTSITVTVTVTTQPVTPPTTTTTTTTPTTGSGGSSGGGGGGSMSFWFASALGVLASARFLRRSHRR